MKKFTKDPSAKLDYTIDWTDELGLDTIADSLWSVPTGVTMVAHTYTSWTTTIWVEGGMLGEFYQCVNTTYTAAGRRDQRTVELEIIDK